MDFLIKNDKDLFKIHSMGVGFILNDYPQNQFRTLHHSSCDDVTRSKTTYDKFYFSTRKIAFDWLKKKRGQEGERWHCCGNCDALGQDDILEINKDLI